MRRLALSLLLFCTPSYAAGQAEVLVDSTVCARAAAYQPGVDVHGRPVKSAELDDADSDYGDKLADSIVITLKADLAKRLGIPDGLLTPEAQLGTLSRAGDGQLLLNGKPVGKPSAADLVALCRQTPYR